MISVGIDVSKGKSTVCIMKPCGEILESPFDIGHTADELDSLISLIKSFDEETRVVMEDTGHYHLPVAIIFSQHFCMLCKCLAYEEVLLAKHKTSKNR
ncbi:MAG: transposase [Ruminococcus sp.]|nr:transposase [Ruminococcus sp.]